MKVVCCVRVKLHMLVAFSSQHCYYYQRIGFILVVALTGPTLVVIVWKSADCQPRWENGSISCDPMPQHTLAEECFELQPRYTPKVSQHRTRIKIDVLSWLPARSTPLHHSA